jgi:hypothetical protein
MGRVCSAVSKAQPHLSGPVAGAAFLSFDFSRRSVSLHAADTYSHVLVDEAELDYQALLERS